MQVHKVLVKCQLQYKIVILSICSELRLLSRKGWAYWAALGDVALIYWHEVQIQLKIEKQIQKRIQIQIQIQIDIQMKIIKIQIQICRGWAALGGVAWVGIMAGPAHRN